MLILSDVAWWFIHRLKLPRFDIFGFRPLLTGPPPCYQVLSHNELALILPLPNWGQKWRAVTAEAAVNLMQFRAQLDRTISCTTRPQHNFVHNWIAVQHSKCRKDVARSQQRCSRIEIDKLWLTVILQLIPYAMRLQPVVLWMKEWPE